MDKNIPKKKITRLNQGLEYTAVVYSYQLLWNGSVLLKCEISRAWGPVVSISAAFSSLVNVGCSENAECGVRSAECGVRSAESKKNY